MSHHLDDLCCPKWKLSHKDGLTYAKHDTGCIWSDTSAPWERVAVKAIDAAMEWWDKRQALGLGARPGGTAS